MKKPLILIICDELVYLNKLDPLLVSKLIGLQKFKNRMINFPYHYTNSLPCSSARSVLYSGKHINVTKITENIETTWQETLGKKNPSINLLGNYYKNTGYNTNYKGKFHLSRDLIPTLLPTYKPLIATQTYLQKFGFDEYNKFGDFCFDRRLGTFNDELVVEQKLPIGNTEINCDFYDYTIGYGFDGVIPFLKGSKSKDLFALIVNFDNPHDIKNSNVETNITTITNTTTQIIGYNSNTVPSISDYNYNFKLFSELPFYLEESFLLNNPSNPKFNSDTNYCGLISQYALKYLFYGTDYFNIIQAQQYQTAYYRIIKQVDDNLLKLYNYFEENGVFDNCVVCLTSDHGDFLGSHGLYQKNAVIYDEGYHVPLMISYPNMNKELVIMPENLITSHINLLPTLMTLCGIDYASDEFQEPFMDYLGNVIDRDYNVIKLSLSILFGPFLIPSLKNLELEEVDNLLRYKANNYNYLTLQSFSVSSVINLNNQIYNCGYYFSLLDVFFETIKTYGFAIYEKYNSDSEIYILADDKFDFGFVGLRSNLILFIQTNIFTNFNFTQVKISKYNSSTSEYKFNLEWDHLYNIDIVSKNKISIEFEKNYNKKQGFNDVFYIENILGEKIFGSLEDINFIIENNYLPKNFNTSNIKFDNNIVSDRRTFVYPFYISNRLFIKSNFPENFLKFLTNNFDKYFSDILNKNKNDNILNLINNDYCLQINIIDYLSANENKLILPGYGLDIFASKQKYFIEIFNLTSDPNEIINLADSSRIYDNAELNNKLLSTLYNNIDKNNLRRIFISTPLEYYFSVNTTKQEIMSNNF